LWQENCGEKQWVEMQWKNAPLGDARRNKRVIDMASHMLKNPSASLPLQMYEWKRTKAAYRFFGQNPITHEALQCQHWYNVSALSAASDKTILFIQDKSELDFSHTNATTGLGFIGNHQGKGINIHSVLTVEYDSQHNEPIAALGLSYQKAWIRTEPSRRKKEKRGDRLKRTTEADYWIESLQSIKRPQTSALWVAIGDRDNDNYKFIKFCDEHQWNFLIRVDNTRIIITESGESVRLVDWARSLPVKATKQLILRARPEKAARIATLSISWGTIYIKQPKNHYPRHGETMKRWCIRVWEDGSDLEWLLLTNLEVANETSALEKISWYESRWLIEEYHKCLKTGCSIEKSQLQKAHGLFALLGLLGVFATRLLAIKLLAKEKPSKKATTHFPKLHIELLASRFKISADQITCDQYWRLIARMGGFIGRKSDGDPGWQTLWKGWLKFQDMVEGVELWRKCG